jgi:O-antigen ligase
MAHWFPAAQYHYLPWHADSLYLELLVERGWTGLVAFLALVTLAMQRLWCADPAWRSFARFIATSLAGVLLVGVFGSVIDAPRVAFLAYFLALFAIQLPSHREKVPMPAGAITA